MLAKEPSERPQSWSEVKERLTAIRERLYNSGRQTLPPLENLEHDSELMREKRHNKGVWWSVAIFAVILVIALVTVCILLKG